MQTHTRSPGASQPPELLTKREAAQILRSSTRSLDEWRATKQLASIKLGGKVFFLMKDLVAFIEARRVAPRKFKTDAVRIPGAA